MNFTNYEDLVGKKLIEAVLNIKGMMIIPAETILSNSHVEKLEKFNINLFDIHVDLVEGEEEKVIQDEPEVNLFAIPTPLEQGGIVEQTSALLRGIETIVKNTGKIPIMDVEEILLPTLLEATQKQNIYQLFAELKAEKDFRYKHCIG